MENSLQTISNNEFEQMLKIAQTFSSSELVPSTFKSTTDKLPAGMTAEQFKARAEANCFIALNIAQRLNTDPFMTMHNLDIIQGKPAFSSKYKTGLINASNRFEPLMYEMTNLGKVGNIQIVEYKWDNNIRRNVAQSITFDGSQIDNLQCVCYSTDRKTGKRLSSPPVTVKMAIQQGWWSKAGSKWPVETELMLHYRSASRWANIYAPDLALGIPTVEELRDDATVIDITAVDMQNENLHTSSENDVTQDNIEAKETADPIAENSVPLASQAEDTDSNSGPFAARSSVGVVNGTPYNDMPIMEFGAPEA